MQDRADDEVALDTDSAERLVVVAARAAIERIEPAETAVFAEIAEGWLARPRGRRWTTPGNAVGFGVEETLVSVIALQAVSAAVGEVLVLGGKRLGRGWLQRWRRAPEPPPAAPPTTLTANQAKLLREACRRHAVTLGLAPGKADVLAEAVIGTVSTAPDTP